MSDISRSPGALRAAVLIPARNEEEALPGLLDALASSDVEGLETVVVVDNGSTDDTAGCAHAAGALVVREPRPGYGQACQRGLAALAKLDPPPGVVAFLDADDYRAPGQLAELLQPIRADIADMVVGVRSAPAGDGVRWHAALGNRLVLRVLRFLYGDTTRDMGPFRAIRWECVQQLGLDDPNYGWYVQMQVRALRGGWRVMSVPVSFQRRTRGRSKVSGSLTGSVAAGWVMLRTLLREVLRNSRSNNAREEDQLRADTSS